MKTKLLLAYTAILVIAMITVPVMAAPPIPVPPVTTANPVNEILNIVKNIQTNVGTILTNVGTILTRLTSLQTDVTTIKTTTNTIKTTTDTINSKLDAPDDLSEPIGYEYYTGAIGGHTKDPGSDIPPAIMPGVINMGETSANVCFYLYQLDPFGTPGVWTRTGTDCFVLGAHEYHGQSWADTFTTSFIKITSDSRFVQPQVRYIHITETIQTYLPGDFNKFEIYS